jgi:hypothetical protein
VRLGITSQPDQTHRHLGLASLLFAVRGRPSRFDQAEGKRAETAQGSLLRVSGSGIRTTAYGNPLPISLYVQRAVTPSRPCSHLNLSN